jgi:uncharacterized protein YbaR (Trm112 family)
MSNEKTGLSDLLACPRCDKTPLSPGGKPGMFRCDACNVDFPALGGIPWLFAEPDYSLGEWRNRWHFQLQQLRQDEARIDAELKSEDLHALTGERLRKQRQASGKHREVLTNILAPLGIHASETGCESYLALRTRLPPDQGLHTYYPNVHRDWSWGDAENEASLEQVARVLKGSEDIGHTLVLGAGACRLAYDLHMRFRATETIATDFNPLLLLVADRIVRGETLDLYEFPIAPKTMDDIAVLRTLSTEMPVRDGFHLVFGDMLRPPFAAGRFDTVVTPWIIDIVTENLPVLAARINRMLRPGGRWANFGSLTFTHAGFSRNYGPEETLAIVEDAGFDSAVVREATIPYMCSPASRHGRRETVFSFAAVKNEDAAAPPRHKALPDWIVTGKESVPLTRSFKVQAATTRIYGFMMSLIDGKRSIKDMAKIMEEQKLMTRKEAEPAIRNFLIKMYDDSQRQSGF